MKARHLLAVVSALALLMTAFFTVAGLTSVAATEEELDFLQEAYIAEGAENIQIEEDGTWTVTGNFALAPNTTIDYMTQKYIFQYFTSDVPVKITVLDRDPQWVSGDTPVGYGQHWIGLYDNWVGPEYFPAGTYERCDNFSGIYTWNKWNPEGKATIRAIYFEFQGAPTATFKDIRISEFQDPKTTTTAPTEARYEWDSCASLVPANVDAWTSIPAGDNSNVTVTVDDSTVIFGNDNGAWPAAYTVYDAPFVVSPDDTAIEYDIVARGDTNIYLFFGNSTPTEGNYQADQYYSLTDGDKGGKLSGTIYFEDLELPAGAFDESGNVVISSIKIFVVGDAAANLVQINKLNLLYNAIEEVTTTTGEDITTTTGEDITTTTGEDITTTTGEDITTTTEGPVPTIMGDFDGNSIVNMADAFTLYRAASGQINLSDAQTAVADMDGNGIINIADAFALYRSVSGS